MSTLSVSNITDGVDTVETGYVVNGSAKAWINFNGTGTIAARDSLNVSSLTDNATGSYTINFSNAFSNSDYNTVTDATQTTLTLGSFASPRLSSSFRLITNSASGGNMLAGTQIDCNVVDAISNGDLA